MNDPHNTVPVPPPPLSVQDVVHIMRAQQTLIRVFLSGEDMTPDEMEEQAEYIQQCVKTAVACMGMAIRALQMQVRMN